MDDGIVLLGMDGKVIDCNQATLKQFKVTREEVIGKVIMDFMFSENKENFIKETQNVLRKTGRAIVETQLQRKNDSPLSVEVSLTRFYDQNRRPTGLLGVARDITERKKIQDGLRESEERFSKAFHNNPAAMAISNIDGQIVNVNESFERLMGYTKDEVIGKIGCDIGLYGPCEQDELVRQLKEKGKVSNVEMTFRQKSGNQVNVLFSLEPITLNKEPYSLGIAIDNTERKKAEEALKESEERFRALVESTSDMIWQVDEKAVYTYISPKVKDILGYEPHEIVGKTPFDLIDEEDEEKIVNSFLEIANKKEPFYGLENWNVHKNGSRVLLETSGVPILDKKGQLLGYRGIDRDITERKKTEGALANAQVILKRQLDEIKFYYDVAPVGLSVFDTNLRFVKVNKRLAEINGIPPEDHVGKSIAEVVPSVAEPLEKLLKQIISSGNPIQNLEITGEATNMPGVKRTLLESFMPMKDSKG